MPKCAIFADTQAEPKSVYTWLDWLEKQLPFPVHRVTAGNLAKISTTPRIGKKSGQSYLPHALPVYVLNDDGSAGATKRQCTDKQKLIPIRKKVYSLARSAIVWIGISVDEIWRMKPSRFLRITHRWPLVDLRMSRDDCVKWMVSHKFPEPPRSACTFCPFHNNFEWRRLKEKEPEAFREAIEYENTLQAAFRKCSRLTGTPFLHRSHKPLSEVDFSTEEERGQLNMFNSECEGLCGV